MPFDFGQRFEGNRLTIIARSIVIYVSPVTFSTGLRTAASGPSWLFGRRRTSQSDCRLRWSQTCCLWTYNDEDPMISEEASLEKYPYQPRQAWFMTLPEAMVGILDI